MKNDIQNATKQNVKVVKNTLDVSCNRCDKISHDVVCEINDALRRLVHIQEDLKKIRRTFDNAA